ncbi:MAG: hypothetical protein Q9157_004597, partial [Trypethelium eluteriae]
MSPIPTSSHVNPTNTTLSIPALVITTPPPATAVITGPRGHTDFTATSSHAFLYFSRYEVEVDHKFTDADGKVQCSKSTQSYRLSSLLVHDVRGDPNGIPTVTGEVLSQLIHKLPQSTCVPGTWTAEPTVIVVVDITYYAMQPFVPRPIPPMTTATHLDLPTGACPACNFVGHVGTSQTQLSGPSSTAALWTPSQWLTHGIPPFAALIAHYESSALSLEGPTTVSAGSPPTNSPLVAHLGSSALTIIPDAPVTSATVTLRGVPVPATLDTTIGVKSTPASAAAKGPGKGGQAANTGSAGSNPAGGVLGALGQGSSSGKSGSAAGGGVVGALGQGSSSGKSGSAAAGGVVGALGQGGSSGKSGSAAGGNVVGAVGQGGSSGKSGSAAGGNI